MEAVDEALRRGERAKGFEIQFIEVDLVGLRGSCSQIDRAMASGASWMKQLRQIPQGSSIVLSAVPPASLLNRAGKS